MSDARRPIGLVLVLVCLASILVVGLAQKSPCASGDWGDGRQYKRLCYSDIVPLLGTEQLTGGRLPFIDRCSPADGECDEYPVLTMYAMRLAASASSSTAGFFYTNALLLAMAAFAVAVCLYLVVGPRAMYFALAPTLLIYAFVNWDLLAVALAAAATLAYVNRRDVWAGVLLGIGAAAKFYPALLLVPFVLGRFREKEPDRGIHLTWAAAASWLAVNAPFAILSPSSWWEFFRFNGTRPADWDSLWFIGCHRLTGHPYCTHTQAINVASAVLFVGVAVMLYRLKRAIAPNFPRWSFGFPLLVTFLLTNKVYSPQYGLWLLPWFALTLPNWKLFAAFEAADVAVFVTRFWWFARFTPGIGGGVPIGAFEIAVLVRFVVLVFCVAAWVRRREPTAATERAQPPPEPAAAEMPA